jgi:glycosyltransferase involved in cell wall biosynthesis
MRISNPLASVLIRVKNEGRGLPLMMESLARQSLFERLELVFLDSGSTDSTLGYLESLNCVLYRIAPHEFAFGETCNLMMALASTDICFFFSGHVVLETLGLIEAGYEEIATGRSAAGFFRQVPNEIYGASVYERAFLRRAFPDASAYGRSGSQARAWRFSNAASVLGRRAWETIWFPDVIASEDALWAREFLRRQNGAIRYFADFKVAHSHNENPAAVEKRVYINAVANRSGALGVIRATVRLPFMILAMLAIGAVMREAWRFGLAHFSAYVRSAWERGGIRH